MKRYLHAVFFSLLFSGALAQGSTDSLNYVMVDTLIAITDTTELVNVPLKVWPFTHKKFKLNAQAVDTLLYSITKEKDIKMKYTITSPDKKQHKMAWKNTIANARLSTTAGDGTYTFKFRNRSIQPNQITFVLQQVKTTTHVKQIKKLKPKEKMVAVAVYDTVPFIVYEGTTYLGAGKNLLQESQQDIHFTFEQDSVPCYWAYLVGTGKNYSSTINSLIDLKTQQPLGDPLLAYYSSGFTFFPVTERVTSIALKGPGLNKTLKSTDFGIIKGKKGSYKLSVINPREAAGEYIYFKVMAFYFVKTNEKLVPQSTYDKMTISPCLNH